MDFDRLEAIEFEGHDLAARGLLNVAVRCRLKAMGQPLRKANRLEVLLKALVKLAKPFRELQGVVFFSP